VWATNEFQNREPRNEVVEQHLRGIVGWCGCASEMLNVEI